ncbi:MCE family protein [candidate division WOR-3 bacterium]|nr:MCE family protein [candidate division WOR-3 bacterium]
MRRRVRDLLVTVFVLIGILLGLFGYFWFSGRSFHRRLKVVRVYFNDVAGLRVGDRVDVLGITKGKVVGLKLDGKKGVEVLVGLERDVPLTQDTRFAIRSLSYLGSDRYLAVTPGIGPDADETVVFQGVNEVLDLETTVARLDRILSEIDPDVLTEELRRTREDLLRIINSRLAGFDSGFVTTNKSLARLGTVLDSMVLLLNKESTAKKLLTSPELYDELLKTSRQLQELIADLKSHPERYFRLRIFK